MREGSLCSKQVWKRVLSFFCLSFSLFSTNSSTFSRSKYSLRVSKHILLSDSNLSANDKQWILHDWSDEESVKILKRCKEAIPSKDKGGKVIIIDMKVDIQKGDNESIETQLFLDMLMMILYTGRERTEKEWAKLFADAGFTDYKITPILGLRSLIEVYP